MNTSHCRLFTFVTATTLALLSALGAHAQTALARGLVDSAKTGPVPVIVQYHERADGSGSRRTKAVRGGAERGVRESFRIGAHRAEALSANAADLARLASDPNVKSVTPDHEIRATMHDAIYTVRGHVPHMNGYLGAGIGVAVIDSGVAEHRDLGLLGTTDSRVVYREDFTGSAAGDDEYGHGTHVAGIIGGDGTASDGDYNWERGLAPEAMIVDLRVLNRLGYGRDSYVIAAIHRAIELRHMYNIRVINLSVGRPVFASYTQDPLCEAVKEAWEAGMVVVAAAGNSGRDDRWDNHGYGTINAPGNSPYAITVGAMKPMGTWFPWDDELASYSSRGPTLVDHIMKPDLVAPGNRIVAASADDSHLASQYPGNVVQRSSYSYWNSTNPTGNYFQLSGTSMAAPMVAGTAAMMLERRPHLTPDQVKAILMRTASKDLPTVSWATHPETGAVFETEYNAFAVGAGYLDAAAAVFSNYQPTGSAASPAVHFDEATGVISIVDHSNLLWGRGVAWGTRKVWGSAAIASDNKTLIGTGVVWGGRSSSVRALGMVWGDTSPWGTSVIWGTHDSLEALSVLVNGEE